MARGGTRTIPGMTGKARRAVRRRGQISDLPRDARRRHAAARCVRPPDETMSQIARVISAGSPARLRDDGSAP